MTTERDKCGLSSLLPMSCRGRAEAFARRLHSRLKSLGSQDDNGVVDEHSWLAARDNSVSISQPRHSSDGDLYLEFDQLESPGSPQEETPNPEFINLINNTDNLSGREEPKCPRVKDLRESRICSNDSDSSDGTYYDLDVEVESKSVTKQVNGDVVPEKEVIDLDSNEKTIVDCENNNLVLEHSFKSPLSSLSLNEESTLKLPYRECTSVEIPHLSDNCLETEYEKVPNDCIDYAKTNGDIIDENLLKSSEIYISHINVENDLVVEYPLTSEVTILPSVEVELIDGQLHDKETENNTEQEVTPEVNREEENLTSDKLKHTAIVEDDSELDDRTPRVRRCSSLKTGKTPPGTPGRKKIVRFADVLGLDLADVRTFLDEIPKIPNSAYDDLKDADLSESTSDISLNSSSADSKYPFSITAKPEKLLVPLFQQPAGMGNFLERVREQQVCLENALVADPVALSVSGTVRVRNLDFNKSVHIRYSLDSWKTFADLQAVYVPNSCDGFSDTFSFLLYVNKLAVGQRLEFAVRFQCKGCQYWDSNSGTNYSFQCLPATQNNSLAPITTDNSDWSGSFY